MQEPRTVNLKFHDIDVAGFKRDGRTYADVSDLIAVLRTKETNDEVAARTVGQVIALLEQVRDA